MLKEKPTFVDVFAGCGGLSLGLMQAGWKGLFAIEKDPFAFETIATNLCTEDNPYQFDWPSWFPKKEICVIKAIAEHSGNFAGLHGEVDMLVGGPPCQGYSTAGRRDANDPRNQLFKSYLDLVTLIRPKLVLLENVRGMTLDFDESANPEQITNYASKLEELLSVNYRVYKETLDVSDFGVPQTRLRFFLVAIRKDQSISDQLPEDPFKLLKEQRHEFSSEKGIRVPVSAKSAISDFEVGGDPLRQSEENSRFKEIVHKEPATSYQRLMHCDLGETVSDTRLANHRPDITKRFAEIIERCKVDGRLKISLSNEVRELYGMKKQATRVLDPERPAPTITSMPDDLLHYSEPRTLTVRENARLQSFPDWFVFRGKYTTGGQRRKVEVPRFTQVANAVPPLAAEAIGRVLLRYIEPIDSSVESG